MCSGGLLLADFVAGPREKPRVLQLADSLTTTLDGNWVVWAFKLARVAGDQFVPLTGRGSYPADATATCMAGTRRPHAAPEPLCTCGFHALSEPDLPGLPNRSEAALLTVALSGRILAFEWQAGGVLLRAERQTVVRVDAQVVTPDDVAQLIAEIDTARRRPDDPEGRLARIHSANPSGAGPVRLQLPSDCPQIAISDDAGWCQVLARPGEPLPSRLLAGV
jgi:hypothetical protein